jgi:signal transduction histidine kinase
MNVRQEALQIKASSIQLLRDIAVAANEAKKPDEVFQYALETISQFSGWSLAHVYWCDDAVPDRLVPSNLWYRKDQDLFQNFSQITVETNIPKGAGLPGRVLESRKPYLIKDGLSKLVPTRAAEAEKYGLRSAFGLPVLIGVEVAAVLEFFSTSVIEMDDDTVDLMAQIGTQLGRVIERKKSEEQINRQAGRLTALAELSRLLAESETDTQKVLEAIAKRVTELVGDTCTLAMRSADGQYLNAVAYYHPDPLAMKFLDQMTKAPHRIDQGALAEVFRTGKLLMVDNLSQDEMRATSLPEYLPYLDHFGIYAILIVPLRVHGQIIGTLAVSRDNPGGSYTVEDQEFLQELGDRASPAIYNAQLFDALQRELAERKQVEAELTELQRLLMDSVDLERLRLAKKLHDDAIQGLYGVIFTLEGMREGVDNPDHRAELRMVTTELQQVINRLQGTFKELSPPTLAPFGLDKAISAFIENFLQERSEYRIRLDLQPDVKLPERIGYTLFRIFHQTVDNIVQHAQADEIWIILTQDEERVSLEIRDNGAGFAPPERWIDLVRQGRYGLARQRERAAAIGGKFTVESKPGEGTQVQINVPIPM